MSVDLGDNLSNAIIEAIFSITLQRCQAGSQVAQSCSQLFSLSHLNEGKSNSGKDSRNNLIKVSKLCVAAVMQTCKQYAPKKKSRKQQDKRSF
jgi:hypothetical protein